MKTLLVLLAAAALTLSSCAVTVEATATGREPHTRYEDHRIVRSEADLQTRRQVALATE